MTLIVGSGRLATHFKHYFHLMKAPCLNWNRKEHSISDLQQKLRSAKIVWLMISDSSLSDFVNSHLSDFSGSIIHSSGALEIDKALSLHPLMTFGPSLEDLSFYQSIPFVGCKEKTLVSNFPDWKNSFHVLDAKNKALYHALCVTSGNFTTILWQESLKGFQEIGLPASIAQPYLKQVMSNLLENPNQALTGPLARKDRATVTKNMSSLEGRSLSSIYQAFVKNYFPEYKP